MIVLKNIRLFLIGILLFPYLVYGQIPEYYSDIDFSKQPEEIKAQISKLISNMIIFPYTSSSIDTWDILEVSDQDSENNENILLVYTGRSHDKGYRDGCGCYSDYENGTRNNSWNREHVWPKSQGFPDQDDIAYTDVHNLKPTYRAMNAKRGNKRFIQGSGNAKVIDPNDIYSGFYPGDEWIGDVARIIMYMDLRYSDGYDHNNNAFEFDATDIGIGSTTNGMPDIFLEWNEMDPVSDFERRRNDAIFSYQMNRNPFIDNPYLAKLIWGGPSAEETWGLGFNIDVFPTVTSSIIYMNRNNIAEKISFVLSDMSGKEVQSGKTFQKIDISKNIPGNYILKIQIENKIINKKIIKL